jgi:hypothetical protein
MDYAPWHEVPEVPVPTTLYKYCSPERIDIVENLQIRFSRPSEFNDTFDSYHLIPAAAGQPAKAERLRLRARLGVLCLTERSDNQLMWVNYAKDHTGFVIGFDARSAFFGEDERLLRKVQYRKKPRVLPAPDRCGCFYKPLPWKYEREWRCVREFAMSESRLVTIEPALITKIVIGHRMQPWHVAQIAFAVQALDIEADFYLSSPSHSSWKFSREPKLVKPSEACGGRGYTMDDPE